MNKMPIEAISNQSFSIYLSGASFDIDLKSTGNGMAISIARDGVQIVSGQLCVASSLIIPAQYLEGGFGNFMFITQLGDIPDYTNFGITQNLWHLTDEEIRGRDAD